MEETQGLRERGATRKRGHLEAAPDKATNQPPAALENHAFLLRGRYHQVKRVLDGIGTICIAIAVTPVLALVALLVALDVGSPLVFWQLRPGRHGRPFKLFKFRTMRSAHDANGNRVPDQLRSSKIGNFLRRSRLDELPQLYNIVVGEMSFVGPRPLLLVDQPQWQSLRLVVRPGLTGWAQVNGGRDISPEDKAALDIWYIVNASLWLDIAILLRTPLMLLLGERVNHSAIQTAYAMLKTRWAARSSLALSPNSNLVISAPGAQEAS
jgi:lipopolysaccharide/colanic/teichoic acid biosynthesis glycosyltransferase